MRQIRAMAVAAIMAAAMCPNAAHAAIDDDAARAIARRHCVECHAAKPAHPSFPVAPKNVELDTLAGLRRHAPTVLQTLLNRTMPLGNRHGMTEAEREQLIEWARTVK
jgi:uncharacterized membrane protein